LSEVIRGYRHLFYLLLAFLAGSLFSGLFFNREDFGVIGNLDKQYAYQYGIEEETIVRLEEELEQERHINQELRAKLEALAGFSDNSDTGNSGS